ncbi:MAG: chromate transporter [Clostridiales bacterium]|nr:MAG: chromate transporter [Clostridiales bacterium]
MKNYLELFVLFFKLGAFTIGGGYVMLPLIEKELVDKKKWYNEEEFLEIISISQSSPGPIVINAAMTIGTRRMGFIGGLISVIAAVLPAFSIIFFLSIYFFEFRNKPIAIKMFKSIRPAVVGIILASAIRLTKLVSKKNYKILIITVISFSLIIVLDFKTVYALLISALIGFIYYEFIGDKNVR